LGSVTQVMMRVLCGRAIFLFLQQTANKANPPIPH